MKTTKSILFLIVATLTLASCGKDTQVKYDNSDTVVTNNSGVKNWDTAKFPLIIEIPDTLDTQYRTAIENAGASWNNSLGAVLGKTIFQFSYTNSPNLEPAASETNPSLYFTLDDTISGFYKQTTWKFVDETNTKVSNNTLASTVTSTVNSKIIKADILFNFNRYNFADYDSPPGGSNYIDMESVIVHELGHFLGLGHTESTVDAGSVMNPSISTASKRRVLSSGDITRIKKLYGY